MNIQTHSKKTKKEQWADDDLKKLLKIAGTKPIDEVANDLGMPVKKVINQCGRSYISYRFPRVN